MKRSLRRGALLAAGCTTLLAGVATPASADIPGLNGPGTYTYPHPVDVLQTFYVPGPPEANPTTAYLSDCIVETLLRKMPEYDFVQLKQFNFANTLARSRCDLNTGALQVVLLTPAGLVNGPIQSANKMRGDSGGVPYSYNQSRGQTGQAVFGGHFLVFHENRTPIRWSVTAK